MADAPGGDAPAPAEHLNIKVTDNNNEVFFKIKRTTQLKKLMDAFCDRQGKQPSTVRFLFDGTRVRPEDTPDTVRLSPVIRGLAGFLSTSSVNIQLTFSFLFCSWTWQTGTHWRSTRSRSAADQSIFYDDISQYYIHTFLSLSPRELVVSVS
jgi:small ubiquitin-related modifier